MCCLIPLYNSFEMTLFLETENKVASAQGQGWGWGQERGEVVIVVKQQNGGCVSRDDKTFSVLTVVDNTQT